MSKEKLNKLSPGETVMAARDKSKDGKDGAVSGGLWSHSGASRWMLVGSNKRSTKG